MPLRLQTNAAVEVRLLALKGEPVASNFGPDQLKFRTDKGDLYVSEAVGIILHAAIAAQRVEVGEPIDICKREVALGNGRKGIRWELSRVGTAPGPQRDGTFALPAPPRPAAVVPETPSKLEQQLEASIRQVNGQVPLPAWGESLTSQSCVLVDSFARVLAHAAQYDSIRGEDVRSLFLSAFINLTKAGSNGRAA
jgi:hypothetical protein